MRDSNRSGRYVQQPTGYRAFVPNPLPPDPPLDITPAVRALLSNADLALGRLDGAIQILPDPDLFVFMYVRKEAVLSSQIEGTQSSLQNLLEAEARIFTPDLPRDVGEVVNYVTAMNYGLDRLAELPVSVRLIREIHERLMTGVRGSHLIPGEVRTSQNWIGASGAPLSDAIYVPPPPALVPEALSDLERFLHLTDDIPLLIRIGLAHAQFETIHPFLDGNGRVGRLLITFLLCERRILSKPVLYFSWYLKRHRTLYYERLQSIRDHGDWESWIEFFLTGVTEASHEASQTANAIFRLREQHRTLVTDRFGRSAAAAYRALDLLYQRPIVSVDEIATACGLTYAAANTLVSRMTDVGILVEITGNSRNRRFQYTPYVELFHD